jgi:DNA-binding response OmpR family regulator
VTGVVMDDRLRILILEDEWSISMLLEAIIEDAAPAEITIHDSLAGAVKVADQPFDLALLDIELTDGKTYEIAKALQRNNVQYVFVSGASLQDAPDDLKSSMFIAKPFQVEQIKAVVLAAMRNKKR